MSTPAQPPVNPLNQSNPNRQMADRDCWRTDGPRNDRIKSRRSYNRLPKTASFTNPRLPRSNSVTNPTNSLPRGRSFQNPIPHTPSAQAAQDGYYHRKAAKMAARLYAEKKAAAAAATAAAATAATGALVKENPSPEEPAKMGADVINVTVDNFGVKIDNAANVAPWAPSPRGIGSRRNSRPQISRSNSRQRIMTVSEDKENVNLRNETQDAAIEAYFAGKDEEDTHSVKEAVRENPPWDGSMPQRKNSRSLIETTREWKQKRELAQNNAVKETRPVETSTPAMNNRPENTRKSKSYSKHPTADKPTVNINTNNTTTITPETDKTASATVPHVPSDADPNSNSSPQKKNTNSQAFGGSTSSKTNSATSEASSNEDAGKWCNDCAGVGLHISSLLSQLNKQRPISEIGAEPTPTPVKKPSWKSMVTQTMLGDSKSKSSTEKARLQQEITVLRATVDFLYKKIERMEHSGTADRPIG